MCCTTPGNETIGLGDSMPSRTNSGATSWRGCEAGLGHQLAQRAWTLAAAAGAARGTSGRSQLGIVRVRRKREHFHEQRDHRRRVDHIDTRSLLVQAAEARARGFYLRAADLYNEAANAAESVEERLHLMMREAYCRLSVNERERAEQIAALVAKEARSEECYADLADALGVQVEATDAARALRRGQRGAVRGDVRHGAGAQRPGVLPGRPQHGRHLPAMRLPAAGDRAVRPCTSPGRASRATARSPTPTSHRRSTWR